MNRRVKLVILISGCAIGASAFAATDGTLGATSTGQSHISVEIGGQVLISQLHDVNSTLTPPVSGVQELDINSCVYSSEVSNSYLLTATTHSGGFHLSDGNNNNISFDVEWQDATQPTGTPLTYGVPSDVFEGGADSACTSINATAKIILSNTDINIVPSGSYTGTIIFVVQPA